MGEMTEDQIKQIEDNIRYCEELLRNNPDFIPDEEQPEPLMHFEPVSSPPLRDDVVQIVSVPGIQQPEEEATGRCGTGSIFRMVRSLLICAVIAVAAGILITKFIANHTTVEGSSMEPALEDGDNLIVEKVSYLLGDPGRFDIIVFEQSENVNYIKRIIGLPGERVRIKEGKIYINDTPIPDSYGNGALKDGGLAENTVTLGSDEYFVLGDNRNSSEDSRARNVGSVKESQIIGKAWFRVTPIQQFGFLD